MWKFERVYRVLLLAALQGEELLTQKAVAAQCSVSIGMVNKVVKKLEGTRAAEATRRGIRLLSPGRLLNLWATERNIDSDVRRPFRLDGLSEGELPSGTLLTGFSGWSTLTGRRPAEYYRFYFYLQDTTRFEVWLRDRKNKIRSTNPNVFPLSVEDGHLAKTSQRGIVCIPQIYVDIYSAEGPEAAPFLKDIVKSHPILGLY